MTTSKTNVSNSHDSHDSRCELRAFRTYGLTGQTIMVRSREENLEYNPWGTSQVPVKITGEYPNFLTAVVLPHMNPVTGRMSGSYPVTIHKHDIILQEIVPEFGDRFDYGDGTDYGDGSEKVRGIVTVADLRRAVSEAVGVEETGSMVDPARWMITEVENSITSCEKCGIRVEIFPSGFVAASFGNRDVVFRMEELADGYRDRYSRRHYKADYFTDLPWEVRLLLEAEDRLGIRVLLGDEDDEDQPADRVGTVKKMFEA